ncbi:MAG: hypothetical protein AAEJ04_02860, partial [Planctomycetota bacterium]
MNPRNLLIAGGLILSLVVVVFLLLPTDPGPLVGAGADDLETSIGTADDVSQGNRKGSGSSGSNSKTSSGSYRDRSEEDGDEDGLGSASGRRFQDEGSINRSRADDDNEFSEIERADDSRESGSRINPNRGSNRDSRRGRNTGRGSSGRNSGSVPDGMVRISGDVVVENTPAAGPTLSGQLQIGVLQDSRSISVNNGRFSVNIPKAASIRFFSAVLEGKPARVISPVSAINGASAGLIRVVVRYDALAMLHLLSAETGEPLADVEVVRAKDYTRSSLPHPGWALDHDSKIVSEESPVALDGRIGLIGSAVAIHARAAGHEWRRLTVDLIDGGERELILERSGSVNLHLVGDSDREGVVLRLRETGMGGSPHFEVPVTSGITEKIEGILPGAWTITLEKGHWAHQPEVYDEIDFDLMVDDLLDLELEIPIDDEERVEVSGSVFIPEGWFIDNF